METRVTLRRWGNSLGVIIPAEAIQTNKLREGEEITVTIEKKDPLQELFGIGKDKKSNIEKIRKDLKKKWSKW